MLNLKKKNEDKSQIKYYFFNLLFKMKINKNL